MVPSGDIALEAEVIACREKLYYIWIQSNGLVTVECHC